MHDFPQDISAPRFTSFSFFEGSESPWCIDNQLDCVVSEFKLQSLYYIHFQTNNLGKGMIPHIPQDMG